MKTNRINLTLSLTSGSIIIKGKIVKLPSLRTSKFSRLRPGNNGNKDCGPTSYSHTGSGTFEFDNMQNSGAQYCTSLGQTVDHWEDYTSNSADLEAVEEVA